MAEAAKKHTPTYNWSLDEAFRHLIRSVRLSVSDALYEMEQLRVEVQKYIDAKPQGHPYYLHKNFRLHVRDHRWVIVEGLEGSDSRCRVAERDVRALWSAPSTPIAALPPSHRSLTPFKKTKPITPAKKPKKTQRTRLISLMKDIGLEKSLLPYEARMKVKPHFKPQYRPSDSTIDHAYKKYASGKQSAD